MQFRYLVLTTFEIPYIKLKTEINKEAAVWLLIYYIAGKTLRNWRSHFSLTKYQRRILQSNFSSLLLKAPAAGRPITLTL